MNKLVILIIEDNDDIRESTAEILELADYEVLQAGNGKLGVEMALKHLPDIILCDVMMPELDGYGVLHLINKSKEAAAIPFIFLTAKTERSDMRKGMEMGADDYLTKPFDEVELFNAIDSRLKKRSDQKQFYSKSLDNISTMLDRKKGMDEFRKMVSERKIRQIKKKQVIYYEGDAVNGIYLVLSGNVKTIKIASDGRELLTGMYTADQYFGVAAVLANENYNETAEAMEDTSLCLLPKELILQLLSKYPDVANSFIKILANNVMKKEEQLLQLAYHSVRKRMAESLIQLSEKDDILNVSRDNLAAMAGMATETVSRILSDFKDEGLINRKGSQIIILDPMRLKNMKN